VQYVLGVEPVEEPERRIEIDALDRGSLVHDILDRFVRDAIERGHPLTAWEPADRERLHRIADACFADYVAEGRTGRALLWRRDEAQIRADLDTFLAEDDGRLRSGLRPVATEHRFDDLEVTLPGGRTVRVAGSIDRVDRGPDGSLVVIDYKTGRAYAKLTEEDPHQNGTRLQLYLYAQAAQSAFSTEHPVEAWYWFTSTKGDFAWRGYPVTPDVAASVEAALHTIADGIAAGLFPARPSDEPSWGYVDCWYCAPDGLSAADRRRDWERKRHDPLLHRYLELTGEVPDDGT